MTEIRHPGRVEGPTLVLRLIQPSDAAYVYALRTSPIYSRYLSEVRGSVREQQQWIEAYKEREAAGLEYYYAIERADGARCGLVRLYDIRQVSFTWGSWILDANKPPKAALESALLSFGVGFDIFGLDHALLDVRAENSRAVAFYRRLGMAETHRTSSDIYFVYNRSRYNADRDRHFSVLGKAAPHEP